MLFHRLSVFAGGWTLEAAEAVCPGGSIAAGDVIDLLGNLVEKSLVALEPETERYRMLDTVRIYASERLANGDDEAATRTRHLAWCLELAERARPGLAGPEQGQWLGELDREPENLLSAHRWCDRAEAGVELGLQLVFLLKLYWYQRGLLGLGHRVTAEALSRTNADDRSVARCRGLSDVGQFCTLMGRYTEARRYLEESLALARALDDQNRIAAVLQPLGQACMGEGDAERAQQYFLEGIAVARSVGNPRQLASALSCEAQLLRQRKDLSAAGQMYAEILETSRGLGDEESVAITRLNLAMVSIERDSIVEARLRLHRALEITAATGSQLIGQSALDVAAGLCAAVGQHADAARYYGAAEVQAERSGLRRDSADDAFLRPLVERSRAALGDVAFAGAQAEGAAWTYGEAIRRALAVVETDGVGVTPC